MLLLTLSGLNFGVVDISASAALGITPCATVSWSSPSAIVCKTEWHRSHIVVHAAPGLVGTRCTSVSYDAPVVSAGAPHNRPAAQVGHNYVGHNYIGSITDQQHRRALTM